MTRIVYVDGQFVPENEARVSVFDRGFLFGDGVYEVSAVLGGGLVDNAGHLARLERSLGELGIVSPATPDEIARAQKELVARNDLDEGIVYLQITRGPADRDFAYPAEPKPTLVMFTQKKALVDSPLAARGITVITVPELRWRRRDVKTVGLLAASMAKQAALDAGADDAWMVEDGFVTEGSSNNAYIVTRSGGRGDAASRQRDSARHHAGPRCCGWRESVRSRSRNGRSPSRRQKAQRRRSSPAPRRSSSP